MNFENLIKYSIVIPHKNTPGLLQRCIDSVPIREDIQIIIIDDNSDQDIVDFSNFPGSYRPNTQIVFSKDNKGAGAMRNIGLKVAVGKWVLFADSDDFFSMKFNSLLNKFSEDDSDIIYFMTSSVYSESLLPAFSRGAIYNDFLKKSEEKGIVIDEVRYKIYPPWGKFFKRSFIIDNKIFFEEEKASNDVMFSVISGHYANKIRIVLDEMYISTIRENSLQNHISYEHVLARYNVAIHLYSFLAKNDKIKWRLNIWSFIFTFRKIKGDKNIISHISQAYKYMILKHFVLDFRDAIMIYFKRRNCEKYSSK